MSQAASALAWLLARTTINRLKIQASRLKQPRYLLALCFGIGYLWLMFHGHSNGTRQFQRMSQVGVIVPLAALLAGISVITMWLFDRTSASLAFLPTEVQFLFPAPISRRGLVAYRVARSQLLVMLNAVIWTALSRGFGVHVPTVQRFFGIWALSSILSLHPLGLALLRVQPVSRGRGAVLAGLRALAALVIILVVLAVRPILMQPGLAFSDRVQAVGVALALPPLRYVVAPFQALVAPLQATDTAALWQAFAVVAGMVVLHLAWVFSIDVAFEEAAATASVRQATQREAIKAYRAGSAGALTPVKRARGRLPLAPTGHPAVAIIWKNSLALLRTRILLSLVVPIVLIVIVVRITNSRSADPGESAAIYLIMLLMIFMMGPRVVRNDLRQDMLALASLKTYPLSGTMMVGAQVAAPVIVLTALQTLLVFLAWSAASAAGQLGSFDRMTVPLLTLAPLVMLVLTATAVALQNGTALLFPSWVRLGIGAGGIEAMGQNMLMTFGALIGLALTLLLPGVAAALLFALATAALGAGIEVGAILAAAAVILIMGLQLALMLRWFGRVFDHTEASGLI